MRAWLLTGTLILLASPAHGASEEQDCVRDLSTKNYEQKASTPQLARLIAAECLQRSYPKQYEAAAIGTARPRDQQFINEMSDVLSQMATAYLDELRGDAVHLIK